MPPLVHIVNQTLLTGISDRYSHLNTRESQIEVVVCDESKITAGIVKSFINSAKPLGISAGLDPKDKTVFALVICSSLEKTKSGESRHRCLVVEFPTLLGRCTSTNPRSQAFLPEPVHEMIERILCRPVAAFYAFDLAPLALALYRDLRIRVTEGVDIQSACPNAGRRPIDALSDLIGKTNTDVALAGADSINEVFEDRTYIRGRYASAQLTPSQTNIIQQAWISQFLAEFENSEQQFAVVPRIDTSTAKISDKKLDILGKWDADALRLHYLQPLETEHVVTSGAEDSSGLQVKSQLFKNKLRSNRRIQVQLPTEHGFINLSGRTGGVEGRSASLQVSRDLGSSTFQVSGRVTSRGRDGPTRAGTKKADAILRALQGQADPLFDNPWVTNFWDPPNGIMSWPKRAKHSNLDSPSVSETPQRPLNSSQIFAIEKMLSLRDCDRIILIRGPPGSGKTSVISRFVEIATASNHFPGIWLVAQSNVAVKNIAEKLASIGFTNWRLLISKDFHYEWHEHLYGHDIQDKLIRSDEFPKISISRYSGCQVMLCTLNEASQIEIGDFMSVFNSAAKTLQKMCLIGDDKQLPPHGQEDLGDLQSVFELEHLHDHLYLLNTQYRMPPQMGDFISTAVYDGLLKSNPQHPISDQVIACRLVDISGTEQMEGDSFVNLEEALAVSKLATFIQDAGKNYRIVTPYDSQRNHIENLLKENGLDWHDKCFNVDSFQVRSYTEGFLKNLRRTNVMLTRFRRGMFIFTSKKFLSGPGSSTLVGNLLKYFEGKVGSGIWLDMKEVEEGKLVLK
ncbi:hypothetical protein GYMLUDRAFT_448451 [Collybiopsis luxurians FD-317 M1]|uniref:DNA2/NAM7 helicase-like C-terminal domain-containing protein n=1 Tax=Collybiopsis luxurians FD-317 M1 TaxID=944289 RepID=A0A0D0BI44_9AGAR|nr:hypothetical protein GYMLUDRAFT_448451 [Collybiopsis luxurians FD-317 M1]